MIKVTIETFESMSDPKPTIVEEFYIEDTKTKGIKNFHHNDGSFVFSMPLKEEKDRYCKVVRGINAYKF